MAKHILGKIADSLFIQNKKKGKVNEQKPNKNLKKSKKSAISELKKKTGKNLKTKDIDNKNFIKTGISGFDELFERGIPKGKTVLIAGGPGTGKTIFCLQMLANACGNGEKCIYLSLEESEQNLIEHMKDFGWNPEAWIKKGNLSIKRLNPYELSRSTEALLAKAKGELVIELESIPGMIPKGFKPDRIVVDSLTAMASAYSGKEDTYRIYMQQFFRLLEKTGANSFLIEETDQMSTMLSKSGDEEFLADGVFVMYNIRQGDVRINAIEVLKLRGAKHNKKLVPFIIESGKGIIVYPDDEVYTSVEK